MIDAGNVDIKCGTGSCREFTIGLICHYIDRLMHIINTCSRQKWNFAFRMHWKLCLLFGNNKFVTAYISSGNVSMLVIYCVLGSTSTPGGNMDIYCNGYEACRELSVLCQPHSSCTIQWLR